MIETRRLVISGQVQGVGYRYSMMTEARRLNITGWVRNRRDGSVEAMVAGNAEAIAAIIDWARRGPSHADVEHVDVELGSGEYSDFEKYPTV